MKTTLHLLGMLALTLTVAAGCGDETRDDTNGSGGAEVGGGGAGGNSNTSEGACSDMCAATGSLACGPDVAECEADCGGYFQIADWCEDEGDATVACYAAIPASSYTCVDGTPTATADCDPTDLFECVWAGPQQIPDQTANCEVLCAKQDASGCPSPTCQADCLATVADDEPCRGSSYLLIECVAADSVASYACGPDDELMPISEACQYSYAHATLCDMLHDETL
jgi:hypothetical protein